MKKNRPESLLPKTAKTCLAAIGLAALSVSPLRADSVIVYARTNGGLLNVWPPYQETTGPAGDGVWYAGGSSGNSSVTNPSIEKNGTRFGSGGWPAFMNQPTLAGTGHVYAIYCTLPNTATAVDETVEISTSDGTLSTNLTLAFSDWKDGVIHAQCNTWNLICYITNNPGVSQPTLTLTYSTTTVYGTNQPACSTARRFYSGPILYDDITDQCKKTPPVVVWGPLSTGQTSVKVANVLAGATNVTVYANGLQIGKLTSGVVAGVNTVPTLALVQNQEIKATQTTNNVEGCLPTSGPKVGGGANPEIRVSFILDQNSANAGPVGAPGLITGNLYHLPATNTFLGGYANPPIGNIVLLPSTCWQTVSAQNGVDSEVYFAAPTVMPIMPDPNPFASLAGISFCAENMTNTGPFDLYIDNIMNGDQMIEDFEWATNGQTQVFLQNPSTAAIPVSGQIPQPDISAVSTAYADSGTKSLRYSFQFTSVQGTIWIRALTGGSGHPNPQIDLTKPVSMRVLLLPVGQTNGSLTISALTNVSVYPGGAATFSVTASGIGPFTYQWKVNGLDVLDATNLTFSVTNLQSTDAGVYATVVRNSTCETMSSAILAVLEPIPTITNQPAHQMVNVGNTATFTVDADGHVPAGYPLLYQWRFGGVDLTDKTNATLSIPNAQLANVGYYDVVVANTYGFVTSVVAALDVVPAGVVPGNGTGLTGDYYNNPTYTNDAPPAPFAGTLALRRVDSTLNFDWLTGSPGPVISNDYFSVRWTGQIQPLGADTYTFYTTTDDGVRLWIGGQLIIDHWNPQAPTEWTNTIALTANKTDLVMEYYEKAGGAVAKLSWSNPGIAKQIVPIPQLYPLISTPRLGYEASGTGMIFNWSGPFNLQSATNVVGPYLAIPGTTSPYTNSLTGDKQRFFRLSL